MVASRIKATPTTTHGHFRGNVTSGAAQGRYWKLGVRLRVDGYGEGGAQFADELGAGAVTIGAVLGQGLGEDPINVRWQVGP